MRSLALSEPICGLCGFGGELLSADPPLRRLQLHAGGKADGVIALPELLALCRLSQRLGMKLARTVEVTDANKDYRLLIETEPHRDAISFHIIAWSERDRQDEDMKSQHFTLGLHDDGKGAQVQVDSSLRIISYTADDAVTAPDEPEIGIGLTEWLKLTPDAAGRFTVIEAVAERQAFKNQAAHIGDGAVLLSGHPLLSGQGDFAGYICRIECLPAEPMKPGETSAPFPAQLMSANLKQPLSRIVANAETIHGRLRGAIRENYAGYARDIASAANHLKELVEDFGDLETIERPGVITELERVDCCELARRAAGLLAVRAADHNISLRAPGGAESLSATGEYRRILQILVNVIGNAVRYSPDGTAVTVTADIAQDGRPAIIVEDEGRGIEPQDRERVFEQFERLGRAADGGSGLGLYISRRLARAMGGELAIEDAEKGARFVLSLPPA
ncbi:sensor histidine kinase [Novosphingopyxis sp.]|uniref:sensor histidine kinase n=1 Tax=Novosphingopyxis sp. TaxID=2709690 RepID=UPI003B5BD0CE